MAAIRASYSIRPDVLQEFNALVPSGERSQLLESMMKKALVERRGHFEAVAHEFATHPDFAAARADSEAFDAASADGLDDL